MVEFRDVVKIYNTKKGGRVTALDKLSLTLPKSGFVCICGKSGEGKSTFVNALAGLDSVDSGEILIGGRSLGEMSSKELNEYRKSLVGFVFQEFHLLDEYSVGQNIELSLRLLGKSYDRSEIERILNRVGLEGYYDRGVEELSGGQKQRIAIARAVVKDSDIIIADEPTGNLDSATATGIFKLLKELSSTKLVVVVSHDTDSADIYADRIITLTSGRLESDRIIESDKTADNVDIDNHNLGHDNSVATSDSVGVVATGNVKPSSQYMSMLGMLRLGLGVLVKNKVRLVLSIIIPIVAFAMLISSISMALVGNTELNIMYKSKISRVAVANRIIERDGVSMNTPASFSQFRINELKEVSDVYNVILPDRTFGLGVSADYDNELVSDIGSSKIVVIDGSTAPSDLGMTMLAGRLPNTTQEVVITDFRFEIYRTYGIGYDDEHIDVATYEDVIGQTLFYGVPNEDGSANIATIVGVASTEYKINDYVELDTLTYKDSIKQKYNSFGLKDTMAGMLVVHESFESELIQYNNGYDSEGLPSVVIVTLSGNYTKDKNNFYGENIISVINGEDRYSYRYSYNALTYASADVSSAQDVIAGIAKYGGLVAIAVAALAGVLIMNFVFASIAHSKKSIGILMGLGASRRELFFIYYLESLVLAIAAFVISIPLSLLITNYVNVQTEIPKGLYVSTSPLALLGTLVASLLITTIFVLIPIIRLSFKKPITVIKNM